MHLIIKFFLSAFWMWKWGKVPTRRRLHFLCFLIHFLLYLYENSNSRGQQETAQQEKEKHIHFYSFAHSTVLFHLLCVRRQCVCICLWHCRARAWVRLLVSYIYTFLRFNIVFYLAYRIMYRESVHFELYFNARGRVCSVCVCVLCVCVFVSVQRVEGKMWINIFAIPQCQISEMDNVF